MCVTTVTHLFSPCICHTVCVQGYPPQQHRFPNPKIPNHVTWAYKRNATISENKQFYTLPEGRTKNIDLLFLMANAPVATLSMPETGSQSYAGMARDMELAVGSLLDMFPHFVNPLS